VDCDCPEAVFMKQHLLPKTCTFGRGGEPRHYVYRCAELTAPLAIRISSLRQPPRKQPRTARLCLRTASA
jgi:hypothetical protein